jgi:hypothetical protein
MFQEGPGCFFVTDEMFSSAIILPGGPSRIRASFVLHDFLFTSNDKFLTIAADG